MSQELDFLTQFIGQAHDAGVQAVMDQKEVEALRNDSETARSSLGFIPGMGGETRESLLFKMRQTMEAENEAIAAKENFDYSSISMLLGDTIKSLTLEEQQIASTIQQKSAVSLFDDPLGAIMNAFTLPWDQQALEATKQKTALAADRLNKIDNAIQEAAQTAQATKRTVNEATIAAADTALANMQIVKAAESKIEAIKSNAEWTARVLAFNDKETDAYVKRKQLEDADEARDQRKKEFELRMGELRRAQKSAEKKEGFEANALKTVNAALMAEGKNPLSEEQFAWKKQTSAALIDRLHTKGMELAIGGREGYTHGETPQDAIEYRDAVGLTPDPTKPAQQRVVEWQQTAVSNAATQNRKGEDGKISATIEFKNRWNAEQASIKGDSPFRTPAASTYIEKANYVTANPIWKDYIAPQITPEIAAGNLEEATVIAAAAQAVKDRKVTMTQAGNFVASVFGFAVGHNNAVNEFQKFTGREQSKYGMVGPGITAGLPFGNEKYDNLADGYQAQRAVHHVMLRMYGVLGTAFTMATANKLTGAQELYREENK